MGVDKAQNCIWGYHAEEKMLRHFFFDDLKSMGLSCSLRSHQPHEVGRKNAETFFL